MRSFLKVISSKAVVSFVSALLGAFLLITVANQSAVHACYTNPGCAYYTTYDDCFQDFYCCNYWLYNDSCYVIFGVCYEDPWIGIPTVEAFCGSEGIYCYLCAPDPPW